MYGNRKSFTWIVPLANIETGQTYEYPVTSFRDPKKEGAEGLAVGTALGEAYMVNKHKHTLAGQPVLQTA